MVKVLLLKNLFDNQEVIALDDEPLQVFSNPNDDLFFVSTKSGKITKILVFPISVFSYLFKTLVWH
jgi:hypothetical protein